MRLPFVSCLMPTKNRRQFIPRALKMFLAQDYPGWMELIIIEDGDDNCHDLALDSTCGQPHHPNREGALVHYHRFEGTLGAKLNYGRDVAKGSVLLQYDDDDWNSPSRVSQQVAHLEFSGKPFVGMSSLIFYEQGEPDGWEYTGEASYAPGSTHCYTREYALAHPRPDQTIGEDSVAAQLAHKLGALSTVSGLTCLVASDHSANTSPRHKKDERELWKRQTCDNFRLVPLELFKDTVTV